MYQAGVDFRTKIQPAWTFHGVKVACSPPLVGAAVLIHRLSMINHSDPGRSASPEIPSTRFNAVVHKSPQ